MTQSRRSAPEALAEAAAETFVRAIPTTAELFQEGYQRWFDPLYAYVSRYVAGRHVRERIVREVLSENLDLLVGRREKGLEVRRLEATANRLIADAVTEAELLLERRHPECLSRQRPG
jgi:hypothetical protein